MIPVRLDVIIKSKVVSIFLFVLSKKSALFATRRDYSHTYTTSQKCALMYDRDIQTMNTRVIVDYTVKSCFGTAFSLKKTPKNFWSKSMMTSLNGNISRVTGPLCHNSPHKVAGSFDVFFDLRPNKRLSKQSRRRWFEAPSRSLWCQGYVNTY